MDLIKLNIPAAFIRNKAHLTWREILYGIDNDLLASGATVDFAVEEIGMQGASPVLVELAGLDKSEPTRAFVERLANAAPQQETDEIRGKWLYLVLAWLFDHRASYRDALQTVEEVYADFGYPPRIAGFVRYMPAEEPDLGSRELNERRLHEKWRQYLVEASVEYGIGNPTQEPGDPTQDKPGK